jgi:hypothetical protein
VTVVMTDRVVYIYYITADGNSIGSELGSSCQGNGYRVRSVHYSANCTCRVTVPQLS